LYLKTINLTYFYVVCTIFTHLGAGKIVAEWTNLKVYVPKAYAIRRGCGLSIT